MTTERRIRETKTRILVAHLFDRGDSTARNLRAFLDSLSDDELNAEYSKLPRMIVVRPFLDRYDSLMAA